MAASVTIETNDFLSLVFHKERFDLVEKLFENLNKAEEAKNIKYFQRTIFKQEVFFDVKKFLETACSSEKFSVESQVIKKLVRCLRALLESEVDELTKINLFHYVFESFVSSCKDSDETILQFLIFLSHILGIILSSQIKTEYDCAKIDQESFQITYQVNLFKSPPVSFHILNKLLLDFSKLPTSLSLFKDKKYYNWFQELIKHLANSETFQLIYLDIFLTCGHIDVKLLEGNLDLIFTKIYSQTNVDEDFNVACNNFIRNSFKICAKFQRSVRFISKLLNNIKRSYTISTCENIFQNEFLEDFSEVVKKISNQQSLQLLEVLTQYTEELFREIAEEGSCSKVLTLKATKELLCSFLKEVKIFAPSLSSTSAEVFINKVNVIGNILNNFTRFLFEDMNFILGHEDVLKCYLEIHYYFLEITILIKCYKDFVINNDDAKEKKYYLPCFDAKQWKKLVNAVLTSNIESCYEICFQMALQKLRALKLQKETPVREDSIMKLINTMLTPIKTNLDIFKDMLPEDMIILMEILEKQQAKALAGKLLGEILKREKEAEWMSWILNPNFQENSTFLIFLFSALTKETAGIIISAANKKHESKIAWLSDDFVDEDDKVDTVTLEKLPEKINKLLLSGEKVGKTLNQKFFIKETLLEIIKVFKCLPLVHMGDDYCKLGLSFAVALATVVSRDQRTVHILLEIILKYLNSEVDASTCFDGGLCINWLTQLTLDDKLADQLRVNLIKMLVRSFPNSQFGLRQLGNFVETSEQSTTLKLLETHIIVYQELGKCWLRAKKRKSDNDLIGNCRSKLAKMISEKEKDLNETGINGDNYKLLLKIAAVELKKALKANEKDKICQFFNRKFDAYYNFALDTLKKDFDEASVSFLCAVVQVTAIVRHLKSDDFLYEVWSVLKFYEKISWRFFPSNTTEKEFGLILSDLLSMTKEFLEFQSNTFHSNCFEIWMAFFGASSDLKKNECQLHLQKLFDYLVDCELVLDQLAFNKRLCLTKFLSFCVSSAKVILTSQMLDVIFRFLSKVEVTKSLTTEDFHRLFDARIEAGSSVLSKESAWDKNKVHLTYTLFQNLLFSLLERCNVNLQLNNDDIFILSSCAFSLEKWVSLMSKRQKDFARIAAYFISTIISSLATVTVLPAVKIHMINCLNHFLSISDSHTVSYLMRNLKPGYQQVFHSVYEQFKKYHKFSGKI